MYYGIQLSVSGILTNLYKTDVAANNLANASTTGFKPEVATSKFRESAREEDGLGNYPSNELLERLGGGVHLQRNRTDHSQGGLERTGTT
ncbi:MAG: hypothetical protein HC893_16000 [Chloroflexaceae bacterium]|nr:hypothetical protein [Chloroflexaceae bacterium]